MGSSRMHAPILLSVAVEARFILASPAISRQRFPTHVRRANTFLMMHLETLLHCLSNIADCGPCLTQQLLEGRVSLPLY